jgi:hypothetical protein
MTKFNTRTARATAPPGPIRTTQDPPVVNHQGGIGYTRDDKSDLFLLATTGVDLTKDAFYEQGDARVRRFVDLVRRSATTDPDWTYRFLTWLRTAGTIRTAALVGGVEAADAMIAVGIPGGRHMVSTVLRRADEPGEAIAYFHATHGRNIPIGMKRGIGDAVLRMWGEFQLLKYDTPSHGVRFADVLAITHAGDRKRSSQHLRGEWQHDLFAHAVDRRYGRSDGLRELDTIRRNVILREAWAAGNTDLDDLSTRLREAGMTWEDVLSALGSKVDKAELWRALIPVMGFEARLKNLRNFDQAGLTDADVQPVVDMLTDPAEVAKSKQLPLRFLSAYRALDSLRFQYPVGKALDLSVGNIPQLPGSTLVLVDTSNSMNDVMADKSGLKRWDAAVLFGLAVAQRCDHADVVSFSNDYYRTGVPWRVFPTRRGESLLLSIDRWQRDGFFLDAGTDTVGALRSNYRDHDRVVLLTDEQVQVDTAEVSRCIPASKPLTTFNLAGYRTSHAAADRNRLILGGLTDHMFPLIARIEQGYPGGWPWSDDDTITGLPTYPTRAAAVTQ